MGLSTLFQVNLHLKRELSESDDEEIILKSKISEYILVHEIGNLP